MPDMTILHRDWCPGGPDCVSSLCEFRRDVARIQEAQLTDMPIATILAYLRGQGFVVGESWIWRGQDALPPGYPPRAEDDAPLPCEVL